MTTLTTPAQAIIATSTEQGGGTFAHDGQPVTEGIAVGLKTIWTGAEITERVVNHARSLLGLGTCLGTWFDHENDWWEIQETAVFADRDDALALARDLGERYIFDMTAMKEIAVA